METKAVEALVEPIDDVYLGQLVAGDRMSVQYYRIEPGAHVPLHDHPHEQAGFLFEGELVWIDADGTETIVHADTSYVLAGSEPHAVENRTDIPAVGVELFSPPRPNPDWLE